MFDLICSLSDILKPDFNCSMYPVLNPEGVLRLELRAPCTQGITQRRMKLDPYLSLCAKINSLIKYLGVIFEMLRIKSREAFQDTNINKDFLESTKRTTITQKIILRVDKWVCIKLKIYVAKETIDRAKRKNCQPDMCLEINIYHP